MLAKGSSSQIGVVGGGITGFVVARELSRMGYPVVLLEARKRSAGTLRDYVSDSEIFFNSTHYLNANSSWYKDIPNEYLHKFDHEYGSYTDIFGGNSITQNFAGPVCDHDLSGYIEGTKDVFMCSSIADRLNFYPTLIKDNLHRWLRRFDLDLKNIHHSALVGFAATRVFPRANTEKIRLLKKVNMVASELYGLPRNALGLQKLVSLIPRNGFNDLFAFFNSNADTFKIKYGENVKLHFDGKNHILISRSGAIYNYDRIIWTANPSHYLASRYSAKVDSKSVKFNIATGMLNHLVDKPFYIQVFSHNLVIFRLYVYNLNNKGKVTIELIPDRIDEVELLSQANHLLKEFNLPLIKKFVSNHVQSRFFTYTLSDYHLIERLKSEKDKDVIFSDFQRFGREAKINSILAQFE